MRANALDPPSCAHDDVLAEFLAQGLFGRISIACTRIDNLSPSLSSDINLKTRVRSCNFNEALSARVLGTGSVDFAHHSGIEECFQHWHYRLNHLTVPVQDTPVSTKQSVISRHISHLQSSDDLF